MRIASLLFSIVLGLLSPLSAQNLQTVQRAKPVAPIPIAGVVNSRDASSLSVPARDALQARNFFLVYAKQHQLYEVYRRNTAAGIPHLITTDLYAQLLHRFLAYAQQEVERVRLHPLFADMAYRLYTYSSVSLANREVADRAAARWANTYLAVAYSILSGRRADVAPEMERAYREEYQKVMRASGKGSVLLSDPAFDYAQFEPLGGYGHQDSRRRYYRFMQWLHQVPIDQQDSSRFKAAVLIGCWIRKDERVYKNLHAYQQFMGSMVYAEEGLSVWQLVRAMDELKIQGVKQAMLPENLSRLKTSMDMLGAQLSARTGIKDRSMRLLSSRYRADVRILGEMVDHSQSSRRAYPRGMDLLAACGSPYAEGLLLDECRGPSAWDQLPSRMQGAKAHMASLPRKERSLYYRRLALALSFSAPVAGKAAPFMHTSEWQRKALASSLVAYAHMKQMGGPAATPAAATSPSQQPTAALPSEATVSLSDSTAVLSYVEPNLAFWKSAQELVYMQKQLMRQLGALSGDADRLATMVSDIGMFLAHISQKQLSGQEVTLAEFARMASLGQEIEGLTRRLTGTELPLAERSVAMSAVVYISDSGKALHQATGWADELMAIVEINGRPYLARGACFSYYEFVQPAAWKAHAWRRQLEAGTTPERPKWLQPIYIQGNAFLPATRRTP